MRSNELERRAAARREPHSAEALSRVRLRTGRELTVINISSSGALVEGLNRLLPGTRVEVHLVTRHGRVLVRSRIVRALVWRLEADLVCYRTALSFDVPVDTEAGPSSPRVEPDGYSLPAEILGNENGPGTHYPNGDAGDRV